MDKYEQDARDYIANYNTAIERGDDNEVENILINLSMEDLAVLEALLKMASNG